MFISLCSLFSDWIQTDRYTLDSEFKNYYQDQSLMAVLPFNCLYLIQVPFFFFFFVAYIFLYRQIYLKSQSFFLPKTLAHISSHVSSLAWVTCTCQILFTVSPRDSQFPTMYFPGLSHFHYLGSVSYNTLLLVSVSKVLKNLLFQVTITQLKLA